jgi:hypothetical protein
VGDEVITKSRAADIRIDTAVVGRLAHRVPIQPGVEQYTLCGRNLAQIQQFAKNLAAAGLAGAGPTEMCQNCLDTEPGFRRQAEREGWVELPNKSTF